MFRESVCVCVVNLVFSSLPFLYRTQSPPCQNSKVPPPRLSGVFWFPSVIFLLCPSDYSTLIGLWLSEQLNSEALLCRVQSERQDGERREMEQEGDEGKALRTSRACAFDHCLSSAAQIINQPTALAGTEGCLFLLISERSKQLKGSETLTFDLIQNLSRLRLKGHSGASNHSLVFVRVFLFFRHIHAGQPKTLFLVATCTFIDIGLFRAKRYSGIWAH